MLKTWGNTQKEKNAVFAQYGKDMEDAGTARAGYGDNIYNNMRTFRDIEPNVSVRNDFNKGDYDYYRPSDRIPDDPIQVTKLARKAYKKVPIIRNVIDLMSDFGIKGIRVIHRDKKIQQFCQTWFEYVEGIERSERFLHQLYISSNVIVRRWDGKVPVKIEKQWKKSKAGVQEDVEVENVVYEKRTLPLKYTFYAPENVEILGGESSLMNNNQPLIGIRIDARLKDNLNKLAKYKKDYNVTITDEVMNAVKNNQSVIPLDPNKVSIFYYRKDDWEMWASPMLEAVLPDIKAINRLKMADMAALDGAISNIRLWRLGSLEHKIIPTKAHINRLRNMLEQAGKGGVIDLVWGPELDFKESSTQVHQFLGPEKYQAILASLYEGLGIPPTLTGGGGKSSGFTNNFIALKTLIERLQYGRNLLMQFWKEQFEILKKAMGYRYPPELVFDNIVLSDEATIKNLVIALMDRGLISSDTLYENFKDFGIVGDIERSRIKRDEKAFGTTLPERAGMFYKPQQEEDLKKIILQSGGVAPSEMGVNLRPRKNGEESPMEKQAKHAVELEKHKPKKSLNGRPTSSKDTSARKKKVVKPKSKAGFIDTFMWAETAQAELSKIITAAFLGSTGKKDVRSLTVAETENLEHLKFTALSQLSPFSTITEEKVYNILAGSEKLNVDMFATAKELCKRFVYLNKREPSINEQRQIQSSSYAYVLENHEQE